MKEFFLSPVSTILTGALIVLMLNIAGALLSRSIKFNYGYLAPISIVFYLFLAYFAALRFGFGMALLTNAVVGAFDGSVCWRLVKKIGPEFGPHHDQMMEIPDNFVTVYTVVIVTVIGLVGALFA